MTRNVIIAACLLLAVSAGAGTVTLPQAGATMLKYDPSVRSAGMGWAAGSVHWGGVPGAWSNPGLMAFHEGARYTESLTAFGIGESEFDLHDQAASLGADGFGFEYARSPLEGTALRTNTLATAPDGSVLDEPWWERAERVGAGLSLFRTFERLQGGEPGLSRHFDVSVGYTRTEYLMQAGSLEQGDDSTFRQPVASLGGLAVVTPLNTIGPTWASGPLGGVRVSLAYGYSLLNDTDAYLGGDDVDPGDPFPRMYASGYSAHLETGFPPSWRRGFERLGLGFLADTLTPLVGFGYSEQRFLAGITERRTGGGYEYGQDLERELGVGRGWELTAAGVWSLRSGRYEDPYGEIETSGSSLHVRLNGLGGVRWDRASTSRVGDLPDVEHEAWSVWLDLSRLLG